MDVNNYTDSSCSQFDIPVVMIVFRRLDLVKQIFQAVRQLKPLKLYIISDGPRNEKEAAQVQAVRDYIEQGVDWNCQLNKNYADKNIGLRFRMPTGVDWVFEKEDKAIFLEDDILPAQSFFWFCRDMLNRYDDNPDVMMVSGMNVYPEHPAFGSQDIIFSRIPLTWGWATWKRAWERFDVTISSWRNLDSKKKLKKILTPKAYKFFVNIYDDLQYQWINDAWDYQWEYAMFMNDGVGIIPKYNMIHNLGMNTEGAEHIGDSDQKEQMISGLPVCDMVLPVSMPANISVCEDYEIKFQNEFYPKTGFIKYLKLVWRAYLNNQAYKIIQEMEKDQYYIENILDDRYKLDDEGRKYYRGQIYRQISGRDLRVSAKEYKKYKRK